MTKTHRNDAEMNADAGESRTVLEVKDLEVSFDSPRGRIGILEGVQFSLFPGEILALVGETGCGKSVTAKAILNLMPKTGVERKGAVRFGGDDLMDLSNAQMREIRGRRIAMIFQNPQSSINPVFTLGEQIFRLIRMYLPEEIHAHRQQQKCSTDQALKQIAKEKLKEVGLTDTDRLLKAYAHQISGGMAQRYRIATALLSSPEVLIADEATSALDVTVQAHILKLLGRLCREKGTAIVFITHDLGIAAQMCDRVAVMYAGRIVETAPTGILFEQPGHPYTQGLLRAVPRLGSGEPVTGIAGMIPDLVKPPGGCRYHPRCNHAMAVCKQEKPPLISVGERHRAACYLFMPARDSRDAAPHEQSREGKRG